MYCFKNKAKVPHTYSSNCDTNATWYIIHGLQNTNPVMNFSPFSQYQQLELNGLIYIFDYITDKNKQPHTVVRDLCAPEWD